MLQNIYGFFKKQPDSNGIFLVGAEHLSSMLAGIAIRMRRDPGLIDWSLWNRS